MIYFLCHPNPLNYQWDIVPLAEGFEELGVPFVGSADYWRKPDGNYLIRREDNLDPRDCKAVIVSTGFLNWIRDDGMVVQGELPDWITSQARNSPVIALDVSDGYLSPITTVHARHFDIILRAHYNRGVQWAENVRPWAFGLTNRIIQSAEHSSRKWPKRDGCVFAFGASHGYQHRAREVAQTTVLPKMHKVIEVNTQQDDLSEEPTRWEDAELWRQCVRRHSPAFFQRIGAARVCACFCGDLYPSRPTNATLLTGGGNKVNIRRRIYRGIDRLTGASPRLIQWDSWRFWETVACSTAALHFDLARGGVDMPVMPVAGVHYLACDYEGNISDAHLSSGALEGIGRAGNIWAKQHYAPAKAAERMLSYID